MLAAEALVVYPNVPRPSYADQVLTLYRERGLKPPVVHEVREVQTALGLVAVEAGVCLVPASVKRLRRDNVAYRQLDEEKAVSPIIMSSRKGDKSPEIALILRLIREMYRTEGIAFGVQKIGVRIRSNIRRRIPRPGRRRRRGLRRASVASRRRDLRHRQIRFRAGSQSPVRSGCRRGTP